MKILITGGAGFIGSNYSYYRFENYPEDEIYILDKLTYAGNLDNIDSLLKEDRVHFVQGDIALYQFFGDLRFQYSCSN